MSDVRTLRDYEFCSETYFLRVRLKLTCRAVAAKAEDLKLKTAVRAWLSRLPLSVASGSASGAASGSEELYSSERA
jgi:hypothetical protein